MTDTYPIGRPLSDFPLCLGVDATGASEILTQSELFVLFQSELSNGKSHDTQAYRTSEFLAQCGSVRPFTGVSADVLDCVVGSPLLNVVGEQTLPLFESIFDDERCVDAKARQRLPCVGDLRHSAEFQRGDDSGERYAILMRLATHVRQRETAAERTAVASSSSSSSAGAPVRAVAVASAFSVEDA